MKILIVLTSHSQLGATKSGNTEAKTGFWIEGLKEISDSDTFVFHAGTKLKGKQVLTSAASEEFKLLVQG